MKLKTITKDGIIHRDYLFKWDDFHLYDGPCPVCGSTNKRKPLHFISREHGISFVKCDNCKAISSSHYVNECVINEFYKSYFNHLGKSDINIGMDNYIKYESFLMNFLSKITNREKIMIMDYGGGSGLISFEIAKKIIEINICQYVDITVVDYKENILEFSDDRISMNYISPDSMEWRKKKYDVVMANDVIEHIFFVRPVLEGIMGCIDRGGILVVKTAYIQPIYSFLLKFGWKNLPLVFYPEHVHDFSDEFFQQIFTTFKQKDFETLASIPSFFYNRLWSKKFVPALIARIIRAPYYLYRRYPFVGGWMLVARRKI